MYVLLLVVIVGLMLIEAARTLRHKDELGVTPDAETVNLADAIRTETLLATAAAASVSVASPTRQDSKAWASRSRGKPREGWRGEVRHQGHGGQGCRQGQQETLIATQPEALDQALALLARNDLPASYFRQPA